MSNQSAEAPVYGDKFPSDELFQDSMKMAMLQHAHRMLVYVLRRPDFDFNATQMEYLLRNARRVNPAYLNIFYEHFSALVQSLYRYVSLEESVTKSGAYRRDMGIARERLLKIVAQFEHQDNVGIVRYLRNLMVGAAE